MNQKGLTVVELIVSFALTVVIGLFLLEVVLFFKDTYANNIIKSDATMRQAVISDRINTILNEKKIKTGEKCGERCLKITYIDESTKTITIDKENNKIVIDDYTAKISDYCFIENISITKTNQTTTKDIDGIIQIYINIKSKVLKNQTFDINIIYQYSSMNENWML